MPRSPKKPCSVAGCAQLVSSGKCERHRREASERYKARQPDLRPSFKARYGDNWSRIRARQLKSHPRCAHCGDKATHVHHVHRKALGGSDEPNNLQSLCFNCHQAETGRERKEANMARARKIWETNPGAL